MYTVITENDESAWSDETGVLYHFPKRYLKFLEPGTEVVYYKGRIRNKDYSSRRLSDEPHYFAIAKIGKVYPDKNSSKGDQFATIQDFKKFDSPVMSKNDGEYFEVIPENRKSNYWRDGVREVSQAVFASITYEATYSSPSESKEAPDENDSAFNFESGVEGSAKKRFVTVYERDRNLRRQAIAIHGCSCFVCGFNFGDFYGEYAEGFIHIHHKNPVAELGGETSVDPERDLVPVCANCHSIIHLKKAKTLSVMELKSMIKSSSASNG